MHCSTGLKRDRIHAMNQKPQFCHSPVTFVTGTRMKEEVLDHPPSQDRNDVYFHAE